MVTFAGDTMSRTHTRYVDVYTTYINQRRTSCVRGNTICPQPSPPPVGAPAPRAPPSRCNVAVVSNAQYVLTVTAAPASHVKTALSKAAWWPWPWKWRRIARLMPPPNMGGSIITNKIYRLSINAFLILARKGFWSMRMDVTWKCDEVIKKRNELALHWAEMRIIRRMRGVKLRDKLSCIELKQHWQDIVKVVHRNRLQWYGHVVRKKEWWWWWWGWLPCWRKSQLTILSADLLLRNDHLARRSIICVSNSVIKDADCSHYLHEASANHIFTHNVLFCCCVVAEGF